MSRRPVYLLLALVLLLPSRAFPLGQVKWQEGFPLRVGQQVLLLWQMFPGSSKYVVKRSDVSTSRVVETETTMPQHQDLVAPQAQSFTYLVTAYDADGRMVGISEAALVPSVQPPPPPQPDRAFRNPDGAVYLSWRHVPEASYYNIYRQTGEAASALVGTSVLPRYLDATLAAASSASYVVRVVGKNGLESADSDPMAVTGVAVVRAAETEIPRIVVSVAKVLKKSPDYAVEEPTDIALRGDRLFLTNSGAKTILILGRDGALEKTLAKEAYDYAASWGTPWCLDATPDAGKVAVTFRGVPHVRVFDAASGKTLLNVALAPPPEAVKSGRVPQPMDVAFGKDGCLWVSDATFQQLVKLSPTGEELLRVGVGKFTDQPPTFKSLNFLTYDAKNDRLSFVDTLAARIYSVDAEGKGLAFWKRFSAKVGPLNLPKGLFTRPNGNLLVVDGLLGTLQEFTPGGEIVAVYVEKDRTRLPLRGPLTLAADRNGSDLFVVSKVEGSVFQLRPPELQPPGGAPVK